MKKLLLSLVAVAFLFTARADEGMWIPALIGKNYDEMVRMGLKLSKDDLYSINNSSLKDAVVQFGGGCTAEMISASGLLITNHHCGYGSIAALSSVEHNYLDDGFWAKNKSQELPAKGLSVLFLQKIYDVTDEVMKEVKGLKGKEYNDKLEEISNKIEKEEAKDGKYVAQVKEYFNGNQYFLLIYKRYTDVRLVATPPKSIGKFGGDTDNWMWPRHTADFSMFRVYAGQDNEPAEYAADNVPYRPKKFLPVSIKGVKEGDYAMIFGYPGRTNRYEIAAGIDVAINEVNPSIVKAREKRLEIMRRHMDKDKSVYLKLTSSYSGISNYWKYFIGQTEQLKRLNVIEEKTKNEKAFTKWAKNNAPEYANLISEYSKVYEDYRPYAKHIMYYSQAYRGSGLARLAAYMEDMQKMLARGENSKDSIDAYVKKLKTARNGLMTSFDEPTEREILAATAKIFYEEVPKSQHPDIYQRVIFKKFGSSDMDKAFTNYAEYVFDNTFLVDSNKFNAFIKNPTAAKIEKDPAYQYAISFEKNYDDFYKPKYEAYTNDKSEYAKRYIKGLMEMNKGKAFYPDANSTMRITYGTVKSYEPQDAVHYDYYTTLDGMMAKYKPNDSEFDLPKELIRLYNKEDYGQYADSKGVIRNCFITTNDITGGNSGSPVINGDGEWIGIAFDGNWEAMSGDIAFDKQYKRTICTDARFILFLIDKLGNAKNLIEEMEIHK